MAEVIDSLRPYFFALKIYFERFPGKNRGTQEALSFLENYAQTLPTQRSTHALLNFANKERIHHGSGT